MTRVRGIRWGTVLPPARLVLIGLRGGAAQRARRMREIVAMHVEQRARDLGELAADLAAATGDALDLHRVVCGGLVAHPRDHRGLGALLDRDALGPRDGAAADRGRVRGDALGDRAGEAVPPWCEPQEREDLFLEAPRVRDLRALAAGDIGG